MKNAEQAANEVKNEGANIFDQLKGMIDEATNGEGNVFDKLKEMFEGKDGEAGVLDQLKEMFDKGTAAAGEMSGDLLREPSRCLRPRKVSPACWTRPKRCSVRARPLLAK